MTVWLTQGATLKSVQAAGTGACIGSYMVTPVVRTAAPSN
jgi:hypothetical protein